MGCCASGSKSEFCNLPPHLRIPLQSEIRLCSQATGLREQAFNVTQSWPGILKFSQSLKMLNLTFIE